MAAAAEAAGGGDRARWGRRRGEEGGIETEGAELAGEDVHGGHGRAWWRRGLSLSSDSWLGWVEGERPHSTNPQPGESVWVRVEVG